MRYHRLCPVYKCLLYNLGVQKRIYHFWWRVLRGVDPGSPGETMDIPFRLRVKPRKVGVPGSATTCRRTTTTPLRLLSCSSPPLLQSLGSVRTQDCRELGQSGTFGTNQCTLLRVLIKPFVGGSLGHWSSLSNLLLLSSPSSLFTFS